jgi:glycosyltransferase involved in cell wall biosynthesis
MRIGLDARLVPYAQKEGIGYYSFYLIDALFKAGSADEYILFYNIFFQGNKNFIFDLRGTKGAANKIFYIPGRILDFFWIKLNFPPIDLLTGRLDLFHTLSFVPTPPYFYLPPQLSGKKVVTIHDIFPLLFPEQTKNVFDVSAYKRGLKAVVKKADAIICTSSTARKDLLEFSDTASSEKVHVVYSGISESICKVTDFDKIKPVLDKYRIDKQFILNVSRLDYNKNITGLIEAFAIFRKHYDFKLVIVGKKSNAAGEVFKAMEESAAAVDIIYLDYIGRDDLISLLSAAQAFVFPSLYEGFGFTNLEAMKCGVPVITSRIPSIREIVGDAAFLIDPRSPEEIAMAMRKVVSDRLLREDLIKKGSERVKAFTWEKAADDTLAIYKKTAGRE